MRHLDVHAHHIRTQFAGQGNRLFTVGCLSHHVVAVVFEHRHQIHAVDGFVFGHHHGGVGVLRLRVVLRLRLTRGPLRLLGDVVELLFGEHFLLMLLLIVFQCHSSLFRIVKPAGPRQPTVSSFHHHDGRRLALRLRTAPSLMDMPVHARAPRLAQRRQPWCKPLHQVVSMQYSAHHGAPCMASMPWKTGLQPRCSSPTM